MDVKDRHDLQDEGIGEVVHGMSVCIFSAANCVPSRCLAPDGLRPHLTGAAACYLAGRQQAAINV